MNKILRLLKALRNLLRNGVIDFFRCIGGKSIRLGGPLGFFSALENPQDVAIILSRQIIQPAGPDALRIKCKLDQNGRQPWPIFWKKIPNARLVGTSLAVLNDKKQLLAESVYGDGNGRFDASYNYLHLPPATRLDGNWTSLISRWSVSGSHNYYHWMMDALPRLALLDHFPPDTGILVGAPLDSFQRETLEILNFLDRCRPTPETHLLLENYYFSSPPAMTGCDNPYAIRFLRDRFLPFASSTTQGFEKIYIARKGTTRKALREDAMISFLEGEGWTIIQAENYSFREQMALLSNARAICSVHGAGLTNLLWCRKGCKVLELCASNFLNGCYEGLASYLELHYRYVVFDADRKSQLKVDLDQFKTAIKALDR